MADQILKRGSIATIEVGCVPSAERKRDSLTDGLQKKKKKIVMRRKALTNIDDCNSTMDIK